MKALLYRNIVILIYFLLLPLAGIAQRAGELDRSFNYGRGENYGFNYGYGTDNTVHCSDVQPDGRILVGGRFTNYNGSSINYIARLNADGSLDATFNTGTGANGGELATIVTQADGKIIIGGNFTSYNSTTRNRIARLNADGSLDDTFIPGSGANSQVGAIAVQSDGKIIIAGNFNSYNGTTRNRIARLNADGSLDATFNPSTGANDWVNTTAVQADGKIIIGGNFTTYNGITRNRIARLNANGSLDTTFQLGTGANLPLNNVTLQPDGKIIIGGSFRLYNDSTRNRIARLNADGSLDVNFNPGEGPDDAVMYTSVQSNGKIIIGGAFYFFNSTTRNRIARLNTDGSLDTTFNLGTGANNHVLSTAMQADGKIIIGGRFTSYNGTARNYLARLNADGGLDATFNLSTGANSAVFTSALQANGKIIIGGSFRSYNSNARIRLARLNADGNLDSTFNSRIFSFAAFGGVTTIAMQADAKIIIGGNFSAFFGSNIKNIARFNTDGSLDSTFNQGTGANDQVLTSALQADRKIIIGGVFNSFNGTAIRGIARLNSDGSLDNTFNPGAGPNNFVRTTAEQADGKIIIGGHFNTYNGTSRNRICRLNTDGSLDATFNPGTGANNNVWNIVLQPDGKIIIGGEFTSFNGISRNRIARLNSDGSLDTTFNPGTGANSAIRTTALQADGKIIIGGAFTSYNSTARNGIARLNADGSLDTSINTGTGANNEVTSITIQPDSKIIISGYFTGYNNLSTPYIARIHGSDCQVASPITVTGNTSFCFGESTILTSSQLTGNLWSTGDTTRSITVNQAGTYTVRSMNNGCTSAISNPITVSVIAPPAPQIAFDSVGNRCLGSEIIVSVTGNHNQFRWNTGATTRSINVRRTGEYSAEVLDSSGCWSLPSRPARIVFDTTFCIIRISIIGLDSLEASIYADRYEWFLDGIQLLAGNNDKVIPIQGNGVYTVRAIIDGRTSPMSEPIVITSGRKSINTPKVKLYPNPTTGIVTLTTSADAESIAITNAVGQLVYTTKAQPEMELNLNHLAKGVYMVQVQSNKGVSTQRLVIQ